MIIAEHCDFSTAMPVKHSEKCLIFIVIELRIRYVSVLLHVINKNG